MRSLKTVAALAAVCLALAGTADAWPRRGGGGGGGSFTTFDPNTTTGTTSTLTLSGGNLTVTGPSSSYGRSLSIGIIGVGEKGKFECTPNFITTSDVLSIGVADGSKTIGPGGLSWIGSSDGKSSGIYTGSGVQYEGGTPGSGHPDLVGASGVPYAVEIDNTVSPSQITIKTTLQPGITINGPSGVSLHAIVGTDSPSASMTCNFGQSAYAVTATTGFGGNLH